MKKEKEEEREKKGPAGLKCPFLACFHFKISEVRIEQKRTVGSNFARAAAKNGHFHVACLARWWL